MFNLVQLLQNLDKSAGKNSKIEKCSAVTGNELVNNQPIMLGQLAGDNKTRSSHQIGLSRELTNPYQPKPIENSSLPQQNFTGNDAAHNAASNPIRSSTPPAPQKPSEFTHIPRHFNKVARNTGVVDVDGNAYVNSDDVSLLAKLGFDIEANEYSALEKTSEVYDQYSYIEKIAGIPKAVVKAIDKGDAFSGEFLKDMGFDVPKGYEMKGDLCCPIEKEAAADPSQTILITGHSGAGKSTLGKALAEKLGLPLGRVDAHPEFKEYVTKDDHGRWQKSLTPGTEEHAFYTDLVHRANQHTIDNSPAASIIEGAQLGHITPEELAKYKAHIVVGGDPEQSIAQRIARSAKKKGVVFSPAEILEKQQKSRAVVDFWAPGIEKFKKLPGVIHYNHTEHEIEPLIKRLQGLLQKKASDDRPHHHLILRIEAEKLPNSENECNMLVKELAEEIGMKIVYGPKTKHLTNPETEGYSTFAIITTSHISLHTWNKTDPPIMQIDIFSCNAFSRAKVEKYLRNKFKIKKISDIFIDRTSAIAVKEKAALLQKKAEASHELIKEAIGNRSVTRIFNLLKTAPLEKRKAILTKLEAHTIKHQPAVEKNLGASLLSPRNVTKENLRDRLFPSKSNDNLRVNTNIGTDKLLGVYDTSKNFTDLTFTPRFSTINELERKAYAKSLNARNLTLGDDGLHEALISSDNVRRHTITPEAILVPTHPSTPGAVDVSTLSKDKSKVYKGVGQGVLQLENMHNLVNQKFELPKPSFLDKIKRFITPKDRREWLSAPGSRYFVSGDPGAAAHYADNNATHWLPISPKVYRSGVLEAKSKANWGELLPAPEKKAEYGNTLTPNTTPNLSTKIQPTPIGVNQDVSNIYGAGDTPYGEKPVKNPFPNPLLLAAPGYPLKGGPPQMHMARLGLKTIQNLRNGDMPGAAINGIGAIGEGVGLLPHPVAKGIGTAVGVGADVANMGLAQHRYNNRPVEFRRNPENVKLNAPENPVQIAQPATLAKSGAAPSYDTPYGRPTIENPYPGIIGDGVVNAGEYMAKGMKNRNVQAALGKGGAPNSGAALLGKARMWGNIAKAAPAVGVATQASGAVDRYKNRDYVGSAIDGIGALGSAAMLAPHPIAKGVGYGVSSASSAGNAVRDVYRYHNRPVAFHRNDENIKLNAPENNVQIPQQSAANPVEFRNNSNIMGNSVKENPVQINPQLDKQGKEALVVSGIHGDEPAGNVAAEKLKDSAHTVSNLNPSGERRLDGKDPNRHFDKPSNGSMQMRLLELIKKKKPSMVLSLHEDDEVDKPYAYSSETMADRVKKALRDKATASSAHGDKTHKGVITDGKNPPEGSLEKALDKQNIPHATIETPSKSAPLEDRAATHESVVKKLLDKEASRLRENVSIETKADPSGLKEYVASIGDKRIGNMLVSDIKGKGSTVAHSYLDPKYRGMGLGKKLYGEVMRRQPEGVLYSGPAMSDDALRVWDSLKANKGYAVSGEAPELVGQISSKALNIPNKIKKVLASPTSAEVKGSLLGKIKSLLGVFKKATAADAPNPSPIHYASTPGSQPKPLLDNAITAKPSVPPSQTSQLGLSSNMHYQGKISPRDVLATSYGGNVDAEVQKANQYALKNKIKPMGSVDSTIHLYTDPSAGGSFSYGPTQDNQGIINLDPSTPTLQHPATNKYNHFSPNALYETGDMDTLKHETSHQMNQRVPTVPWGNSALFNMAKSVSPYKNNPTSGTGLNGYFDRAQERVTGLSTLQQDAYKQTGRRAETPEEFKAFVSPMLSSPDMENSMNGLGENSKRYLRYYRDRQDQLNKENPAKGAPINTRLKHYLNKKNNDLMFDADAKFAPAVVQSQTTQPTIKVAEASHELKSSNIKAVGYDKKEKELEVHFHSGGEYKYKSVPESIFERIKKAKSPGRFFHKHVKKDNSYEYEKVAGIPDWVRKAMQNNDKKVLSRAGSAGARARIKNIAARKNKAELDRFLNMGSEAAPKVVHQASDYIVQPRLPGI